MQDGQQYCFHRFTKFLVPVLFHDAVLILPSFRTHGHMGVLQSKADALVLPWQPIDFLKLMLWVSVTTFAVSISLRGQNPVFYCLDGWCLSALKPVFFVGSQFRAVFLCVCVCGCVCVLPLQTINRHSTSYFLLSIEIYF